MLKKTKVKKKKEETANMLWPVNKANCTDSRALTDKPPHRGGGLNAHSSLEALRKPASKEKLRDHASKYINGFCTTQQDLVHVHHSSFPLRYRFSAATRPQLHSEKRRRSCDLFRGQ